VSLGPEKIKAEFFRAIGHTDDRHLELPSAERVEDEKVITVDGVRWHENAWLSVPQVNRSFAGKFGDAGFNMHAHCGWWWCYESERGGNPPWDELRRALRLLRRHGIDEWGVAVSQIACLYDETSRSQWETRQCKKASKTLMGLYSRLDGASEASRVVWGAISRITVKQVGMQKAAPGRRTGEQAAILAATRMGWKAGDVAAIFLLAGVFKGVSFTLLRKRMDVASVRIRRKTLTKTP
jgi:hypothetical protein